MFDLVRFHQAHALTGAGFADALHELRRGRKTGHWIWYIFPQLAGLGRSPMAERYGLRGPEEGAAYLADGVLAARLVEAATAVHAAVTRPHGVPAPLEVVMGSRIDAQKLVSSMTLFSALARQPRAVDRPDLDVLAAEAEAVLAAAAAEGYPRCAFTEQALRRGS